jgi:hypothetical protein
MTTEITAVDPTPSSKASDIVSQSYNVIDITQNTGTNGYYSKFNTGTSQSFMGTVGSSLLAGAGRALPESFKTDVQVLSDFRLGTFLRRKGIVSGDTASIVDGVIDFMRSDKSGTSKLNVPRFSHTTKFIPVILKSEFKLAQSGGTSRDNFYVIFDSTPDKISFSKSATWNQKDFYGRSEPIQVFASSSAITFSLTGMFFSDSEKDHRDKIDLENRLFAFVTPSKNHFMPSPVEVRIGEWKRLRCIVTSVTIDSSGPWRTSSTPISSTDGKGTSLPSHSPYMYEVTFNFTVVSEANTMQYAEDIVDVGHNGGYTSAGELPPDLLDIHTINDNKYKNIGLLGSGIKSGDNNTSIIYTISGNAGQEGTLVGNEKTANFGNTTAYLKSLGLPTDANGSTKTAALAQISSGLTATVQTAITRNYGTQITKIFGR